MSVLIEQQGQYMEFDSEPWVVLSPIEQSIREKIEKYGTPLRDWDVSINYGIKTGCNEAFIINEEKKEELIAKDPKSAEIIRPILRGKDIKRYGFDFANLYIIAAHNGYGDTPRVSIENYPAIKEWLDKGGIAYNGKLYKGYETIAARADQGDTPYNLRSCVYMDDFNKPKIAWASVGETYFSLIDKNMFLLDTNYFFATERPELLLAILNSKIITQLINQKDTPIGEGGAYRHYKYNLETIPVITDPGNKMEQIIKLLKDIQDKPQNQTELDNIICDLYHLTEEEKLFVLQ